MAESLKATTSGPKRALKTFKMDDVIDLTDSPTASQESHAAPQLGQSSPVDMFSLAKQSKSMRLDDQSLLDEDDDFMDALDQLEESADALGAVLEPKTSKARQVTSSDSVLVLSGESQPETAITAITQLLDVMFNFVPEEHDKDLWQQLVQLRATSGPFLSDDETETGRESV
eukprot:m.8459 g.8459  ORF g.8459 m.8459 type:complete len:172 (-) comp9178_c0_seq1:69-584(-)